MVDLLFSARLSVRLSVRAVQESVHTDTVLVEALRVHVLPGWGVGAVGIPGVAVDPVEDPDGDYQDDAHQHHQHHQAATQHQQSSELLLEKFILDEFTVVTGKVLTLTTSAS